MSSKDKPKNYELVLEGLENETPQTLQKVKGILIGNMELSIPEVQKILESYPLTIKRSESETELSVHYSALKSAGAKVLLLKPAGEAASTSNEIEFALDLKPLQTTSETKQEPALENNDSQEIEFELNFDDIPAAKKTEEEKPAGTYELNLNEDPAESLKELEKELGESLQLNEQNKNISESALTDTSNEFSLDLQPASGGLELIDSPALANAPLDSGSWEADRLSESLVSDAYSTKEAEQHESSSITQMSKIEESLLALDTPPPAQETKSTALEIDEPVKAKEKVDAPGPVLEKTIEKPISKPAEIEKKTAPVTEVFTAPEAKSLPAAAKITVPKPAAVSAGVDLKSMKKAIPNDLLIPIIVGGLLLGIVNWFYFSSKEEQKAANAPKIDIPEITEPQPVIEVKAEEAPSDNYGGTINTENISAKIAISVSVDKITAINLELNTPKPAELTPEEIVQEVPVRIWLRKAEIEKAVFTKAEDGSFNAKSPVKLYFEQGEQRERIIGEAVIKVTANNGALHASIVVEHNTTLGADLTAVTTATNSEGKFSASFKLEVNLDKIIAEKPQNVDSEPKTDLSSKADEDKEVIKQPSS